MLAVCGRPVAEMKTSANGQPLKERKSRSRQPHRHGIPEFGFRLWYRLWKHAALPRTVNDAGAGAVLYVDCNVRGEVVKRGLDRRREVLCVRTVGVFKCDRGMKLARLVWLCHW